MSTTNEILVVDIEAACWLGHPPEGMENEIIEIGICVLQIRPVKKKTLNEGIIVKPEKSEISYFCTDLTSITPEMVEQGISLKEACYVLRNKYHSQNRPWASFGNYDRLKFEKECASKEIEYPFSQNHFNIKSLFALKYGLTKEIGLARAIDYMHDNVDNNIKFEGKQHRGMVDAWNIATIVEKII